MHSAVPGGCDDAKLLQEALGALDFCPYAAISGARILWRTLLCLADKLSQTACPSVLRFMVA